ncbi:hypothetical protein H4R20_002984 [Coemansia guatemalensis]|uniref:PHD-type domain-containing protein n=1 Tax=Coemansia guatemalensis TaxID=2761395 RepID=A0A9W8HWI3_9FUNG|nr:hypothetical protein H4R20_002984 [Coemansia guatemalensis]
MPRAVVPRLAIKSDASVGGEQSSCGLTESLSGSLAGGFGSSVMGLGHSDILGRKRSLDNTENIPPFRLDGTPPLTAPGAEKPGMSLLDLAAQQHSQSQRKQRRTAITASSPGGHQRIVSNPRRATLGADPLLVRSLAAAHQSAGPGDGQLKMPSAEGSQPAQVRSQNMRQQMPPLPQTGGSNSSSAQSSASSTRLRRLPRRNLKPLDFSSLHQPRMQVGQSRPAPGNATAASTAGATAPNKAGAHSSGTGVSLHSISTNILALPVSPAQSSPVTTALPDLRGISASSPGIGPVRGSSGLLAELSSSAHPTPPGTVPRHQPAFSGLLASAYQRASARRSSQRALCFEDSTTDANDDDAALLACDPVLGPRCPVIGDPCGVFNSAADGTGYKGHLQTDSVKAQSTAAATHMVQQARAAFEAAVSEQAQRGRPAGRKPGRPVGSTKGRGKGSASKRPISECKYCGKQYKYHSKLASHEQHCSSRLEALLYSADESDQHTIHCLCGPRHDRPLGSRDELAMVQCDNCLMWLHIECVELDEDNLPEEYFCPRCSADFDDDRSRGRLSADVPSTPRRRVRRGSGSSVMSPESHRLATLLADVPNNDGSETEEEPMSLRISGGGARRAMARRGGQRAGRSRADGAEMSSEDTMSISDVAEVTRFHRQGSSQRKCRSPVAPRMAQSETNLSPVPTPSRRRVRAGGDSAMATVHTDALSSDFLGLPLPESIFSRPSFEAGSSGLLDANDSIAPGLCTQQGATEDISRLLAETQSQPQWSLAQLTSMLGCGSSGYLDQALADLGLGLGGAATGVAGPGNGAQQRDLVQQAFSTADPPLGELVDLPVDNEFSALLDSIASGNGGTDGDAYSSLEVDDILDVGATGRLLGGRICGAGGGNIYAGGHGSSSTITIMQDDFSQDASCAVAAETRTLARPPPGLPAMIRERNAGGPKRSGLAGAAPDLARTQAALSLPSNPPSMTGLSDMDVGQLIAEAGSHQILDWQTEGDALERELEGLINFDA